jgi:hypothetical protein
MTTKEILTEIDKIAKNKFLPDAIKKIKLKKLNEQLEKASDKKPKPKRVKKSADDVPVKKSKTKPKYKEGQEVYCSPHAEIVTIETIKGWDAEIGQNEYVVKFHDGKTQTFGEADLLGNKKGKKAKKPIKNANGLDLTDADLSAIEDVIANNEILDTKELREYFIKEFHVSLSQAKSLQELRDKYATVPMPSHDEVQADMEIALKKGGKPSKPKPALKYKGKDLKILTKDECDELHKEVKERRQKQKKAEKKSKSKPVFEKIVKNVATAAKQAVKNVPAADLKDDPKGELNKMVQVEKLAKKFLSDLRAILGDDYDKDAIEGEFKEVHDLIKGLKTKYGK